MAPNPASLGRDPANVDRQAPTSPGLTLYNSDFRSTVNGYFVDPQHWIHLDVAAGEPVTVNWVGRFRGGVKLQWYRWSLDIEDLSDETPRIDEATDLAHWSVRSASTKSASVGPFAAGEEHFLYVEVNDSNGFRTLAVLHLTVVAAGERQQTSP
jgi:hypothetical protein